MWLGSDMVSIPLTPAENIFFYVGIHLGLGLLTARPWALCACVAPVLLPLVPGLVDREPDVPGWAEVLSVIGLLLAPVGVALVYAGSAARRRLLVPREPPAVEGSPRTSGYWRAGPATGSRGSEARPERDAAAGS